VPLTVRTGLMESRQLPRAVKALPASIKLLQHSKRGYLTLTRIGLAFLSPTFADDLNVVTRTGISFEAPARDWMWLPIFEVVIDDCYRSNVLVQDLPSGNPVVVDIGAHVGSFVVQLACLDPAVRCIAFEPSIVCLPYLRHNVEANHLRDRIEIVHAAVTGTRGEVWHLYDHIYEGSQYPTGARPVPAIDLDEVVDRAGGKIDLLKMDCEGSEHRIVASASDEALKSLRATVFEYHPVEGCSTDDLFGRLNAFGLRERWRVRDNSGRGVAYLARK
jgi:FkbM family methyltransferase